MISTSNHCFDTDLLHLLPAFFCRNDLRISLSCLFDVLENACQTSLVSSIFIDSLVWDEILTFLVDGIISQVHTEIVEIATKR